MAADAGSATLQLRRSTQCTRSLLQPQRPPATGLCSQPSAEGGLGAEHPILAAAVWPAAPPRSSGTAFRTERSLLHSRVLYDEVAKWRTNTAPSELSKGHAWSLLSSAPLNRTQRRLCTLRNPSPAPLRPLNCNSRVTPDPLCFCPTETIAQTFLGREGEAGGKLEAECTRINLISPSH